MRPRRTFKLDLGDFSDLPEADPDRRKPARRRWTPAPKPGQKPVKAPVWTPSPGARRVKAEAGQRLAQYVARFAGSLSVNACRRLIEQGCCRVNGQVETHSSRILDGGEVVEFFPPDQPREHVFDPRRLVLDRDGVIAYDKPAWLAVTRGDGPKDWSLLDILKGELGDLIPVHRLDADTSGLVLMARTRPVADRLEAMFRDHAVQKTYLALVRGHPREQGTHRSYLVKVASGKGFERWKSGRGADAREAVTAWTVRERIGTFASLVEVQPATGRYHQIRIHFSELGHPLYGDRLYGDRADPVHVPRHMLHAWRVELPHPAGGEAIRLTTPLPGEFGKAIAVLRRL